MPLCLTHPDCASVATGCYRPAREQDGREEHDVSTDPAAPAAVSAVDDRVPDVHVVVGATGHLGSAVARSLLDRGEPVTVVTRSPEKARPWESDGATAVVVDVHDPEALRAVLPEGGRLFALNPPADPTGGDTDAEENRTGDAIAAAIRGAGRERVVALSTYGARPGTRIGDLGTLYRFEQHLTDLHTPVAVVRVAYLLSNWDGVLTPARNDGVLPAMLDERGPTPMVAPADVGVAVADLLTRPEPATGLHFVEGPERYSPTDVAQAFAVALGRPVDVTVTPREGWVPAFREVGFSPEAAESYAGMTALATSGEIELPDAPTRGSTTLQDYVEALVRNA